MFSNDNNKQDENIFEELVTSVADDDITEIQLDLPAVKKAPDVVQSKRFLDALCGCVDSSTVQFTFQLYSEAKDCDYKGYHLTGTFEELEVRLVSANRHGLAVAVMVNKTDGKGRKKENVTTVRALFVDLDGSPLCPVESSKARPHLVIETSPGRFHAYWLVENCSLSEFKLLQLALANKFDGDKSAADIAKPMRLPGFLHQKGTPSMSRIKDITSIAERYKVEDLVELLDLEALLRKYQSSNSKFRSNNSGKNRPSRAEVERMLEYIDSNIEYPEWRNVGFAIHDVYPGEAGLEIWDSWSCKGDEYAEDRCKKMWESFNSDYQGAKITIATLVHMAKVRGWNPTRKNTNVCADARGDKHAIALRAIASFGSDSLLSHAKNFYQWKNGVWSRVDKEVVKRAIHGEISERLTSTTVNGTLDLVQTIVYKDEYPFDCNTDFINCGNGELHWINDNWELKNFDKYNYRTSQLPVSFNLSVNSGRFSTFLDEIFSCDEDGVEKKQLVLELMGYSLMCDCQFEKFVILVGNGQNGKSVLVDVLKALVGKDNFAAVQPAKFEDKFQRAYLQGKLINVVTELKSTFKIDDGQMKSLASGEETTAEHKYGAPFTFKPYATIWIATNHMPQVADTSDGFFRRPTVIEFNRKFSDDEKDVDLKEKLCKPEELEGVLNMALKAFAEVLRRGAFTRPESCERAIVQWRSNNDRVRQFLDECCEKAAGERTPTAVLYEKYKGWCDNGGIKNPLNIINFSSRMRDLGCVHKSDGTTRYLVNVKIKGDSPSY